jgi:hypothetical protein
MNQKINPNEPAFPVGEFQGMTKFELIAALALSGRIAHGKNQIAEGDILDAELAARRLVERINRAAMTESEMKAKRDREGWQG